MTATGLSLIGVAIFAGVPWLGVIGAAWVIGGLVVAKLDQRGS